MKADRTFDLAQLGFAADSHAGRILQLVAGPVNAHGTDPDFYFWLSAGEIAARLDIHKSEASRQLRLLLEQGLLERRRRGRNVDYKATADGYSAYEQMFKPHPQAVTLLSVDYKLVPQTYPEDAGFWALSRETSGGFTKLKIGTREECEQVFESIRQAILDGEKVVIVDTLAADIERALNS